MLYDPRPYPAGLEDIIKIDFEGDEVEVVREAYREDIARKKDFGEDPTEYENYVAQWRGEKQTFKAYGTLRLLDKLGYFAEATDERVETILDTGGSSSRAAAAGWRYRLGQRAINLIESIKLQSGMDDELDGLFEEF